MSNRKKMEEKLKVDLVSWVFILQGYKNSLQISNTFYWKYVTQRQLMRFFTVKTYFELWAKM